MARRLDAQAREATVLTWLFCCFCSPRRAAADATLFLGANTTPENRKTQGFAVGAGSSCSVSNSSTPARPKTCDRWRLPLKTEPATCCCRRPSRSSASSRTSRPAAASISEQLGTLREDRVRAEYRGRGEGDAGRPAAAARGLSGVQAGRRCAGLASAPHLRRTEPEVLRPSTTCRGPGAASGSACSRSGLALTLGYLLVERLPFGRKRLVHDVRDV